MPDAAREMLGAQDDQQEEDAADEERTGDDGDRHHFEIGTPEPESRHHRLE